MPKIVFIKLEGAIADEFTAQRKELEAMARKQDPAAFFPPEMFISYMLDIRRTMLDRTNQKVENVTEIE